MKTFNSITGVAFSYLSIIIVLDIP